MRFSEAKQDCDSALGLELNVKTLLRRGTAWLGLQDVENARKDFKHVLSLEPNNRWASCLTNADALQTIACLGCRIMQQVFSIKAGLLTPVLRSL